MEWNDKEVKKKKGILRKLKEWKISRFPAFAPCAKFNGGSARKDVMELTDLCYLDFDHINKGKIREAMDILCKDPNVVMASRSVSDFGLHILVRYQLMGNATDRCVRQRECRTIFVR